MGSQEEGRKGPGPLKDLIAGGAGGVCLVIVGHPLDTIKVRLQTQLKAGPGEKPLFNGTFDCAMKTIRQEGPRGLYKGMLAPLLGVTPLFSICFFGYGLGQSLQKATPTQVLNIGQHFFAGGLAGVMTTIIMTPGERVKCLMQVQMHTKGPPKYLSSIDCGKQLLHEGGIRNLYRGTVATMLRDVPGSAFYFGGYEWMLRHLTPHGKSRDDLSPLSVVGAGSTAGVLNWVVAIAPDTLKSRLQTAPEGKYRGVRDVFAELIRTEGPTALFRGLTPIMLRAVPANAACFLGYEVTVRLLNQLW